MDPRTGEILALANEPTFNPNAFRGREESDRRNRAVQDVYEPGSTFKVVTASAAIEEGVVTPDDPIDVSAGSDPHRVARIVDDIHRYGVLSFTDVIVKSSNVGAIKIGLRLGRRAPRPLRAPLRVRQAALAGLPRREPGHRLGPGTLDRERARVGRRWATRSA